MAQTRKKINGKWTYLPDGVTYATVRGEVYLAVSRIENGKRKRSFFSATEDGLKEAKALADTIRKEKNTYGSSFGAITDDEKQAIDLWRAYRTACQREACDFLPMSEVMREALERVQAVSISPTMEEAAKQYLDALSHKMNGESTPHLMTVRNRLRHVCAALGAFHLCNIVPTQISDFLETLRNPQTGKPAKATTKKQYLNLIKGVFQLTIKRGRLDAKKNAAALLEAPQIKREEPKMLTLEEVCRVFAYLVETPAEHKYIPVLAVGFFCGARLAERCRLRYQDILLSKQHVYLSCAITKTNVDRRTYFGDCFMEWIRFAEARGVQMEPNSFLLAGTSEERRKDEHNRLLKRIAARTGVSFPKNSIRHTAATYMTELHGFTSTANQLGHGEGMLARHYRISVTKDEALAFFSISPTRYTLESVKAAAKNRMRQEVQASAQNVAFPAYA